MSPAFARAIAAAVAVVVLVVGYLLASATVPLMWADAIRDQIGGQLDKSVPLALFYGFTFSFLPLLLAWQCRRRKLSKRLRLALAAAAVLLSIPNVLTLGVIYGRSPVAADARAVWADSANWFGTWSQIFMVAGISCAVVAIVLGRLWLRRGREKRLRKLTQKLIHAEAGTARATKTQSGS